jgi:anti-repressor protein
MNDLILEKENELEVTSLNIAEWTEKEHKNILADIRKEIKELGEVGVLIFKQSSYINSQNKSQPCYIMNRDGVMQLALKYDATSRYKCIQKLKELEKPKQYSLKESLQMNLQLLEEKEKLELENKHQQEQIVEMKPKVDFADTITESDDCLSVAEYAKVLCNKGVSIGRNRLYSWFRSNEYLRQNNEPYQMYMKYFRVIEKPWTNYKGETNINIVTLINGKGQIYFHKKISEDFGKL